MNSHLILPSSDFLMIVFDPLKKEIIYFRFGDTCLTRYTFPNENNQFQVGINSPIYLQGWFYILDKNDYLGSFALIDEKKIGKFIASHLNYASIYFIRITYWSVKVNLSHYLSSLLDYAFKFLSLIFRNINGWKLKILANIVCFLESCYFLQRL